MFYKEAMILASKAHTGQMYGDVKYINHLVDVDRLCVSRFDQKNKLDVYRSVAYLHDILEDTHIDEPQLYYSFSGDIVHAVVAMTKVKGESYDEYIAKVKANATALFVKQCDTLANLRQSIQDNDDWRILKYSSQFKLLMEK